MTQGSDRSRIADTDIDQALSRLQNASVNPLDFLPHVNIREKLIDLVLKGEPEPLPARLSRLYSDLNKSLRNKNVENVRVVVFGGGTGLSNIIGGDCRSDGWGSHPFSGLKQVFPNSRSIVSVADDGGSTGELLKDTPLIALGDLRHVLLSSIQHEILVERYQLSSEECYATVQSLARIFNHRYRNFPEKPEDIERYLGGELDLLPDDLGALLRELIVRLFVDPRLAPVLQRPHCIGNLLLASAIYKYLDPKAGQNAILEDYSLLHRPVLEGLGYLGAAIGAPPSSVLPCTSTPTHLRVKYANGVETTGEAKSGFANRGVPVDSVHLDFSGEPLIHGEVFDEIARADILILAPGSLYSSIIPVFKIPGIAEAVRNNKRALKILISNLWVQAGETDLSPLDPDRKFRVSDMIRAYERNIPGGTVGLFNEVLCLSLKDVPASVIQNYSVEGKIPIYLDREVVDSLGYTPVESGIYSRAALDERGVIHHDGSPLAEAIKVLYCTKGFFPADEGQSKKRSVDSVDDAGKHAIRPVPAARYRRIHQRTYEFDIQICRELHGVDDSQIKNILTETIWKHHDIPIDHLSFTRGVHYVSTKLWTRSQRWDNVYSFYDPVDMMIKIRADQYYDPVRHEVAFLIALGQSLLGTYARQKIVEDVSVDNLSIGKVYHLYLHDEESRKTFFMSEQLDDFLRFARMYPGDDLNHYTRLINGDEGFTPPGLLMGLMYAWYLDNTMANHIEYKMAVMKLPEPDLIPEQKRIVERRVKMISFFRDVVFATSGTLN